MTAMMEANKIPLVDNHLFGKSTCLKWVLRATIHSQSIVSSITLQIARATKELLPLPMRQSRLEEITSTALKENVTGKIIDRCVAWPDQKLRTLLFE